MNKLAGAFDRMADRLEAIEGNGGVAGDGDKLTRHVRRYMPFYALATVWALMLLVLPTKQGGQEQTQAAGAITQGTTGVGGVNGAVGTTGVGGSSVAGESVSRTGSGVGGTYSAGIGANTSATVAPVDPLAWNKTGKTIGGEDCAAGIRQLPWSRYAAPCVPRWTGTNNGGSTARGVTSKDIVVVRRYFPDSAASQAVDAFVQAAGFASSDEFDAARKVFFAYMNKKFELWGRHVKLIEYESENGDSTQEALSQGKEGACADADAIIGKYHPFAVFGPGATGVFGECAAEKHLNVWGAGAYYPEWWYKKYHPYLFSGVMECTRIAYQNSEYLGKRVVNRPAIYARGTLHNLPRKIAIYVPDNDKYKTCVEVAQAELKNKYHYVGCDQCVYYYALDIQRFPDEAAKAIVQFRAVNATTVYFACDPLSPIFLTQDAAGQNYYPEWITNGAGLTDVDQFARLWDQGEIQWALWGQSQLGDNAKILGPKGEGTITYKKATGREIPPGTQTEYYAALGIFSILQATGPVLTPFTMAATYPRVPPGGAPEFEVGYTSYQDGSDGTPGVGDHTAVDDMREIYWVCTNVGGGDAKGSSRCQDPKGYDGKGGVYVPTYHGKRFRNGEWPVGNPPIFKERK